MVINGLIGYVNNYGATPGVGSGSGTTVRVVDLVNNVIVGSPITVGLAPAALAITPNGEFVYSANYTAGTANSGTLSKISTTTNLVVATIGPFSPNGFSGPFGMVIAPNGLTAYVSNFGSNNFFPFGTTVSVVDLVGGVISATIDVGIQPSGIAITPDGTKVLVSNYNTLYGDIMTFSDLTAGRGTVNIINTATNTVVAPTIAVDQSPDYIAITPDGKYALVSNYTSNTVNMIAC
jgi:DNA-binding beta-propeller fold protein YncE